MMSPSKGQLYPYQQDAVDRLKNGSILCGKVGSGKSMTALAYYYIKVCHGQFGNGIYEEMTDPIDLYIITTARKRDTMEWEGELNRFLLYPESTIYSINIVIDSWNNIKKYTGVEGAFFIFDEQRITGYGAWVKAFLKIAKHNKWILLTATPGDTWSDYIPVFIANGFYRNKTDFIEKHAIYSRYSKYPRIDRYIGQRKLKRYRDEILIDMDYQRSAIRKVEKIMVDYDRQLYRRVVADRWNVYEETPIQNSSEWFYTMRKVSNSSPERIEVVLEILEDHPKAIIFYNFDYELEILKNAHYQEGTIIAEYNGHKHEKLPEGNKWVYLVNYMAGAEGWNCITTDTIIFYSQNYSYKMLEQASGRIDRLNSPYSTLYYYRIRSSSSIDTAIYKALVRKKDFNEYGFVA